MKSMYFEVPEILSKPVKSLRKVKPKPNTYSLMEYLTGYLTSSTSEISKLYFDT